MAFTKSTVATNNISNLANKPLESAPTLKQKFDQYGIDDKVRFNSLIDELEATTGTSGAENIGSKTISGVTGNTIWAQLQSLYNLIVATVLGQIPDNSLTNEKFSPDIKVGSLSNLVTYLNDSVVNAINSMMLVSAKTLYVRTDGNDSNNGLTDTPEGAFKTIQAAVDSIPKRLDANVTVNVAAGTYSEVPKILGFVGSGQLTINGDSATSTSRNLQGLIVTGCSCTVKVIGFNLTTTSADAISVRHSSFVDFRLMNIVGAASFNGVYVSYSSAWFRESTVSNKSNAVVSDLGATIHCQTLTGTGNTNALTVFNGGEISSSGTEPTGTFQWNVFSGGVITNALLGSGTAFPATTGTMTVKMDGVVRSITPTGACTFNATGGVIGQTFTFEIVTSGTSSYTLTWGTNFKTTGTLATGTVSGKYFTVTFRYDGGTWVEIGRTVAM